MTYVTLQKGPVCSGHSELGRWEVWVQVTAKKWRGAGRGADGGIGLVRSVGCVQDQELD